MQEWGLVLGRRTRRLPLKLNIQLCLLSNVLDSFTKKQNGLYNVEFSFQVSGSLSACLDFVQVW